MRRGTTRVGAAAVVICLLLLTTPVASPAALQTTTTNQSGPADQSYPATSWALGVVVPDGTRLQDGTSLHWGAVTNLTALLTLPNISLPDRVVYGVVSVMMSDSHVLQVAAGIYPNATRWLTYAWAISNVESVPLTYCWVLNASGPEMAPGARVSVSIFRAMDAWHLRVVDLDTGSSVSRLFPGGSAPGLKAGDQEVFAFESYSRTGLTFKDMGNLTLWNLFIDGQEVESGIYSYSEWDPSHNPVFVVGSSGTSPPSFLSFEQASDGSFVWGFERGWTTDVYIYPNMIGTSLALFLLVGLAAVLALVVWLTRKDKLRISQV